MSRIRSVHPGFFTDERLVETSIAARMLFIGLGIEADDKGIFEWKLLTLKMRIFPADNVDVGELLAELLAADAVRKYEVQGRHYGAIRNFRKFQKPKTPNDIHPITDEAREYVALAAPISEPFPQKGETFPQNGEKSRLMEDGGGIKIEPNGSCASGELPEAPDEGETLKPEHIRDKWNELAGRLGKPKVRDLTPERRQLLKARIAQYDIDDFVSVFGKVERSPFLRGDTGWQRCTFDWIFKKANFQKALEGNYDH